MWPLLMVTVHCRVFTGREEEQPLLCSLIFPPPYAHSRGHSCTTSLPGQRQYVCADVTGLTLRSSHLLKISFIDLMCVCILSFFYYSDSYLFIYMTFCLIALSVSALSTYPQCLSNLLIKLLKKSKLLYYMKVIQFK